MKNTKKILSLVMSLAMLALIFSVIPTVPASAAAGDVFSVTDLPDGWRFYTSSYVTRTSGSKFTLGASTNKGNGLDNYGILAANSLSTEVVRASTTYRIKFRVETWFTLAQLEVNIDTGTALWGRTNSVQRFTDLASRSSNSSGGGSSKLYTDLTFDVTTPSTITGNQHFVIGIIPQSNNVGSTANLAFKDITITELMSVDVINAEDSSSFGTLYCVPGDDAVALLENAGYPEKWAYDITPVPATVAADTTEISVSYTYNPEVIQNIDFGTGYGDGSWHYYPSDAGSRHITLENGQMSHDASTAAPTDSNAAQHGVTLANNYLDSGLKAGKTYNLTFELSISDHASIKNYLADIRFGKDIWTDVIAGETIRYSGDVLAALVTGKRELEYDMSAYTITLPVKMPETGWTHDTARNILLSVYGGQYKLDNVTIAKVPAPEASFTTHSLVLAERIGVNFFMDLSGLTAEEKSASYMTFAVTNSDELSDEFNSEAVNDSGYYRFTCQLSSVQMAETITPIFHYGDGIMVIGTPYSVKDYIDYVVEHSETFDAINPYIVPLVKSLGDYGHYAQIYLGNKNSWTAGTDYTAIAKYRAADYTSSDHTAYLTSLNNREVAMVKEITGSAVTRVQYNLNFDSGTYINIKLTTSEQISASAVVNGSTLYTSGNEEVQFRTQGLPILLLGDGFVLNGTGTTNTTPFYVRLSGLSYIRTILNSGTAADVAKDAMASLYDYYRAACRYHDMITYGRVYDYDLDGESVNE